jgi:DNA-binding NtrC family response regulator
MGSTMAAITSPIESAEEEVRTELLSLLIVDDERPLREACREVARALGFDTQVADEVGPALRALEQRSFDIVLLDLRLPGASGMELLQEIKQRRPETEVILMTGYGSVPSAVQAMKLGAYDYVAKPFNLDELKRLLQRAAGHVRLAMENRMLREKVRATHGFGNIIGRAPEMEKLYRIISKVARSTHPVLIHGESGTGKELVARAIHFNGPSKDRPFLPVDCGSLVPTLIESELFGYVKGAFTGANRAKDGLLAMAEGGTIFLDEIGELPVDMQAKLLRALQEREIRPVGATRSVPIDVRILAATNRDLELAVAEGTFRKDLYFRLNVVNLRIPPLRERKQDIPLLVGHFMERLRHATAVERSLSDEALRLMLAYDWPGNVRELENCLERASTLSSGPVIQVTDLPTEVQNASAAPAPGTAGNGQRIQSIAELERHAILNAILQTNGDKLEAARGLGIGKTTLYRKLKEYGVALK